MANAIIVSLYRDYFATPKQREVLLQLLELNDKKNKIKKYHEMLEEDDNHPLEGNKI